MNDHIILAVSETPMMAKVIFWILLLLWALGAFWVTNPVNTGIVHGRNVVLVILLGILGWAALGF